MTDAMTAHLDVPVLTETLEGTVLRDRPLNLLRLIALIGAIPATLATADAQRAAARGSTTEDALRWTLFGAHVISAALMTGRAAAEAAANKLVLATLTVSESVVNMLVAAISWYEMTQTDDPTAKKVATAHATFESVYSLWQFVLGIWLYKPVEGKEEKNRDGLDLLIDVLCGLGELSTCIAELVLQVGEATASTRTILFRLGNWGLRGAYKFSNGVDNTRFKHANAVTISIGGLIVAVDLADVVWEVVDTAKG